MMALVESFEMEAGAPEARVVDDPSSTSPEGAAEPETAVFDFSLDVESGEGPRRAENKGAVKVSFDIKTDSAVRTVLSLTWNRSSRTRSTAKRSVQSDEFALSISFISEGSDRLARGGTRRDAFRGRTSRVSRRRSGTGFRTRGRSRTTV